MGGVSGILLSEILVYLNWMDITDAETQQVIMSQLFALDNVYIKYHHEQSSQAKKATK